MNLTSTINDEDHHTIPVLDAWCHVRSPHHQDENVTGGVLAIVLHDRAHSLVFVPASIFPFFFALALALATFARSITR